MQFFEFIFLARSWASDRVYLVKELARVARKAELQDKPLTFILYPEGTLVSKDTRPISKKYAEKLGIVRIVPLFSIIACLSTLCLLPARLHAYAPPALDWSSL